MICVNDQGGLRGLGRLEIYEERRLTLRLPEAPLNATGTARLRVPRQGNGEPGFDAQASWSCLHVCWHRHKIQRRLLSNRGFWSQKRKKKKQEKASRAEIFFFKQKTAYEIDM